MSERPQNPPLTPAEQQLDLDGRLHDIAEQTERMRLFEPAPRQLDGQTHLDLDNAAARGIKPPRGHVVPAQSITKERHQK